MAALERTVTLSFRSEELKNNDIFDSLEFKRLLGYLILWHKYPRVEIRVNDDSEGDAYYFDENNNFKYIIGFIRDEGTNNWSTHS